MIFKETLIKSLSFAVRDSRSLTYAAHFSAFLICLSYRPSPIRPFGAGKADDTRIAPAKDRRRTHFHSLKSNNQK